MVFGARLFEEATWGGVGCLRVRERGWAGVAVMALAPEFVEEHGGGGADVEGIDGVMHGDGDVIGAGVEDLWGQTIPFTAQDDATIVLEWGMGQEALIGVWMGGDAAKSSAADFEEGIGEANGFDDGEFEDRAHGCADGSSEVGVGGGFAEEEGLSAEADGAAEDAAEVFGIGKAVGGDQEAGFGGEGESHFQGGGFGDASAGEVTLVHGEADQGFQEGFGCEVNIHRFRTPGEGGLEDGPLFRGNEKGQEGEVAFEEALDQFGAFGDEQALVIMV